MSIMYKKKSCNNCINYYRTLWHEIVHLQNRIMISVRHYEIFVVENPLDKVTVCIFSHTQYILFCNSYVQYHGLFKIFYDERTGRIYSHVDFNEENNWT